MNGLRKRKKLKAFNFLRLIHARTHIKFTQQWKSTLRLFISGRHIGVYPMYTNMTSPYKAL